MIDSNRWTRQERVSAALIALLAATSVGAQLVTNLLDGRAFAEVVWAMLRYFTIQTNVLVAISWGLVAAGRLHSERWLLAMSAAIAGVGIVFHALLSHLVHNQGVGWWANQGVHSAVPVFCVVWFIASARNRDLRWRDTLWVMPWPMLYCLYALSRGAVTGEYPYPFFDLNKISLAQLLLNIAGLSLFFWLLGVLLMGAVRLRRGAS